jgi:glutaconate CoA-transferase subunit A
MSEIEITPDEIMVTCIAHQIEDGETVVQGIATPLVAAGYMLAVATHAPHIYFASAIGGGMCRQPAPLGLARVESLWLDRSLRTMGFAQVVTQVLPVLRPKEFFRPAQVDPWGNTNNIAFGKDYLESGGLHPRLRLPGSGGIPDVTTFIRKACLYVPRHSPITFVQKVDVCSGMGYNPARKQGRGPIYLISDLGQFDFQNNRLRLTTFHPGVTIDRIQQRTGFELEIAPDVHETPLPTDEELRLLRQEIDPLGIRKLELLSGAPRRQLLVEILAREQ